MLSASFPSWSRPADGSVGTLLLDSVIIVTRRSGSIGWPVDTVAAISLCDAVECVSVCFGSNDLVFDGVVGT